jgi:hypothetical protein
MVEQAKSPSGTLNGKETTRVVEVDGEGGEKGLIEEEEESDEYDEVRLFVVKFYTGS